MDAYEQDIMPNQIEAVCKCGSNNAFKGDYHYHEEIELLYCVSGEIEILSNAKEYRLKKGDIALIPENVQHAVNYPPYATHCYIKFPYRVLFPRDDISIYKNYFSGFLDCFESIEVIPNEKVTNRNLESKFTEMAQIYAEENYGFEFMLRAYVLEIMTNIFYDCRDKFIDTEFNDTITFPISKIKRYIKENYATVSLKNIVENFSFSYSYFSKKFYATAGVTYKQFLIKVRIDEAIKLLNNSNMSITDISMAVGFSSTSHFIETFKKLKSVTPTEYRSIKK